MNTVFLRLDGPLQSWGRTSRSVYRETADVPTFSGVVGLICAALGLRRGEADARLADFAALAMGVRVDRPGVKLTDYHTAGAKVGMWKAEGGIKITQTTGEVETHVMRKEYLADASFLVALRGDAKTVADVEAALREPVWPPFLGRKSCPPSLPVCDSDSLGDFPDVEAALKSRLWHPRLEGVDPRPAGLLVRAVLPAASRDGYAVADVPRSFVHRAYDFRNVREVMLQVPVVGAPLFENVPRPDRRPATMLPGWRRSNTRAGETPRREVRLAFDHGYCVFCKEPARHVHHKTYERAGREPLEDLRSLCKLCHDAVTLLEYAGGLTGDRIDPCDPSWRDRILAQRVNVLTHRDQLRRNPSRRPAEEDD